MGAAKSDPTATIEEEACFARILERTLSYDFRRTALTPNAMRRTQTASPSSTWESASGKYFVAWILGVPAVVLIGIYAFTLLL
jgi:hypothetical protein